MLEIDQARALILAGFSPLDGIDVPVGDALGMVPTTDLFAPHDLPRFNNSAMDGYAVRTSDIAGVPTRLTIAGEVRAGEPGNEVVASGTAWRIMTGAMVPEGADAIVPVENTSEEAGRVVIETLPPTLAHIRPAGDDVKEGDLLVASGSELLAGELALIASMGLSPLEVHRRPRVAVLSTGDELVAPEDMPGTGQIRDSNSVALRALVAEAGGTAEVVGPVPDDRSAVRAAVLDAARGTDLIVSSGGVSVGRYDFVKDVLEEVGALGFWRVAMQPGKPVASGRVGDVPFIGLPGNPVSIHIGFEQFVRPAIRKMRGCSQLLRPTVKARLSSRLEKKLGRLHLVRVRLSFTEDGILATPTGGQGSHIQSSLVDCHGVARFDIGSTVLEEGDEVVVEVWRLP